VLVKYFFLLWKESQRKKYEKAFFRNFTWKKILKNLFLSLEIFESFQPFFLLDIFFCNESFRETFQRKTLKEIFLVTLLLETIKIFTQQKFFHFRFILSFIPPI